MPDTLSNSRNPRSVLCNARATVYLVHADCSVRQSLARLLVSHPIDVVSFGSGREYLEHARSGAPACLILGLELPDIHGLDLQRRLSEEPGPPIIFIGDRGDTQCTVRAIKAGAVEFITKPVDSDALLAALELGFSEDARARERSEHLAILRQRYMRLTPREREVLPLVISGLRNKQAAWTLGISEVTLQVHRGQIMRKMVATSFAELVRMGEQLNLPLFLSPATSQTRSRADIRCLPANAIGQYA